MHKRPRTPVSKFEAPCTSVLTSVLPITSQSVACMFYDNEVEAMENYSTAEPISLRNIDTITSRSLYFNDQYKKCNPIDFVLTEIDIGLGLVRAPSKLAKSSNESERGGISIQDELDAVIATMRVENDVRLSDSTARSNDAESCVSCSGSLGQSISDRIEHSDTLSTSDVLRELSALEVKRSTTIISPPLMKSIHKRRRQKHKELFSQ